ncbi:kinase-like protein [Cadophora sp. DSE1049]|nr:kinase-like protein [Cadophora sp. DSE1049]
MLDGPDPTIEATLSAYFPIDPVSAAFIQRAYTEEDITRIALLLAAKEDGFWSRTPRLYTVLRRAGLLSLQNEFASLQITDSSFPFSAANLPQTLNPSQRGNFLQHQPCIMTESTSLGLCEQGKHCTYQLPDQVPFQNKGILGSVGSYTDPRYMALIMSPVADCDLSRFLKLVPKSRDGLSSLKTFFGCLATAVQYLHKNRIRHKDIKPSNVLVKDGNVLLTDFGLSRDCNHTRSTTEGPTARTAKYCAPEVADYMPRSYSSDMWSLGCVFLEMMTVLKGLAVEDLSNYLSENGSHAVPFSMNLEAVRAWMEKLERSQEMEKENGPLAWIEQLLCEDRGLRPTAYDLVSEIINYRSINDRVGEFCGICCRIEDDAGSMMSEGLFVGKDEDGDDVVVKPSVEDEMGLWIDDPMSMILTDVLGMY